MVEVAVHLIIHFFGIDGIGAGGTVYGKWIPYDFWSGVAGSFIIGALAYLALFWFHHTCHASTSCWRFGKYPVAGGMFKVCHKHHPDLDGKRPTLETITRLHGENS